MPQTLVEPGRGGWGCPARPVRRARPSQRVIAFLAVAARYISGPFGPKWRAGLGAPRPGQPDQTNSRLAAADVHAVAREGGTGGTGGTHRCTLRNYAPPPSLPSAMQTPPESAAAPPSGTTTLAERERDQSWHRDLAARGPPGPGCNPGDRAVRAVRVVPGGQARSVHAAPRIVARPLEAAGGRSPGGGRKRLQCSR